MRRAILVLVMLTMVTGCPVTQPQQTPVPPRRQEIQAAGVSYRLYVPSYHTTDRQWPLVITLHGTYGWDGSRPQIDEWKYLAEQRGLIVAAPDLRMPRGSCRWFIRSGWRTWRPTRRPSWPSSTIWCSAAASIPARCC